MREDPGIAVARSEVASIFCNLGVSLCEVEAFDAEQGRSRIAKYIEEAVIEPPKPPPGDGEFEEDGELAGTDSASRGAAVPSLC